jgi:hypothetical protein
MSVLGIVVLTVVVIILITALYVVGTIVVDYFKGK